MTKGTRSALGFACAAVLYSASTPAVTVSWSNGTGFWDLVANWSPSQLPSSGDDVVINVAGQQTITHRTGSTQIRSIANTGDDIVTITSGSSLTVAANALSPSTNAGTLRVTGTGSRLRFSGSTLNNTGGTLDAQDGGLVELLQGTIIGGTLTTSGSGVIRALAGSYGTLDGVTLNGTYLVGDGSANSNSYLRNSLVNNGTLALSSGAAGSLATTLLLGTDVTISGTGSLTMSDSANNTVRGNTGTERLTNAAGHTIQGSGSLGFGGFLAITNQGTISANQGTPLIIRTNAEGVLNTGTIQARDGGTLQILASAIRNYEGSANGVIQALDGSTIDLGSSAVIEGGILTTTGSGLIRNRADATLDGVTNNGVFEAGDGSSNFTTTLLNVITNNGTLRMNSGVGGTLTTGIALFGADATLSGTGTLTMADGSGNRIYGFNQNERLTNSAGHTIQGSGNVGGVTLALTNQGLIVATQSTPLIISPNSTGAVNTGTLRADGGTLDLRGMFYNTGGTLDARNSSIVQLSGATVAGGTLTSSSGGLLRTAPGQLGRLDGVTLNGTYVAGDGSSNTTTQLVGTVTNNGTLAMNSAGAGSLATNLVLYQSDVTLAGSGTLAMASAANNVISGFNNNERLTNSASHTILGSGNIGNARMTLTNQGLIVATQATPLIVQPNSSGVFNTGTLRADGGTLDLRGMFYNAGGALEAVNGSVLQLSGATVAGGTLTSSSGGLLRTAPGQLGRLDGVTLNGTYVAGDGSSNTTTQLVGTIDNNGTLAMNSSLGGNLATNLVLYQSDVTLTGSGVLAMANGAENVISGFNNNERLTNSVTHTVAGSGNIGNARMTLTNQGLIVATQATPLIIQPNSSGVINAGTLRANGGTLELRGLFTNFGGTLDARNGSILELSNATVVGGTLTSSTGGVLRTRPATIGQLDSVTLNGTYVAGDGTSNTTTRLVNSITNNGTLAMNSSIGGNLATNLVLYQSDVTLDGTGTLAMANSTSNVVNDVNGNEVLTNSASHTIQGAGRILVNLQNAGTVRASGSAGLLANRGIIGPSGTVEVAPDGILTIAAASSAGTLRHNGSGAGSLALGANSISVHGDYNNANFGIGNAFNPRANVSGTGLILAAGNTAQTITGASVTNGTSATPTLTIGNLRVGANAFDFQVANTGTTGPSLRGAIQTSVNGGNITDVRLLVTPQNFGPVAPGSASGNIGVTFNVASAGSIAPLASQTIHVANNFGNVPSQTISVALGANAAAYNLASGGATPSPITFANQRVGGTLTQALTVSNTAPAGSFTEVLNASFGANTGVASNNGGSISGGLNAGGVAAGGPANTTAMSVGLDTSVAGARTGSVTLNYVSNGTGTSGLAPVGVGSQTINVSGNVYQAAIGQLNTAPLNFGTVQVGQSVSQTLSISNIATGAAGFVEDLNARFGVATGVGSSLITGTGSISGLLAGTTNASGMVVGVNTSAAGTVNGAIPVNFYTAGAVNGASNGLGELAVGSADFGVSGIIQAIAQVVDQARPVINNPVIDLGNVRINTASPTQYVSVTNQATGNPQAALNASISAGAPVTASGSFNLLAPGGTNANTLQVGLNTSTAGARSGTATVAFVSDASNVGNCEPNCQLTLASQNVTVQGNVFRLAQGQATDAVTLANFRVGSSTSGALTVTNAATNDGYSERLNASVSGNSGAVTATSGSVSLLNAGSVSNAISATIGSGVAGLNTGSVTLSYQSDGAGTTGASAIGVGTQTVNVQATGYNLAAGSTSPSPITFANQRIGGALTQALTVSNTAPAGSFTEVLNASFGANTGLASNNGGSISGGLNAGGVAAGGPANTTAMSVGLDTSVAGARTGSVTLNYVSNGTGTSGLAPVGVGSQTINVSGNVYQAAIGQLNTPALNFGTVQVGQSVSQTLSISNIATGAAGFVEDLNARFGVATGVGSSLITGTGSISGLLAGTTNASGMVVGVNTSAAGTVNGAIPVNFYTAGAVNGASNGLGELAVGSADFGVSGIIQAIAQVVDQARPVINNPVISLGNVRINTASPTQYVSVTNQATGNPQAALNASISAGAPVTASGSFNLLAPGGTNANTLQVGLNTSTAGARNGTATVAFVSDASNVGNCEPNCQLTLASQNVTVQGNVYRLANPVLGALSVVVAGRVGDTAPSTGVSITNSSPDSYTEGLNAAIATGATGFNASGTVSNLVAGATNASTLRVGLNTSTAGTYSGAATVTLASTGSGTTGAPDLALPDQNVSLTGRVYTPAVAQVADPSVNFGIVHVGDAVAARGVSVTNAAAVTALNDVLRGSLGGATGAFSASGTLGAGVTAGQTDSSSLTVRLDTSTAGVYSGSATASFVSHDADLSDLGLGSTSISLAGQVNNYADPRFVQNAGAGTLSSVGMLYEFSFGSVTVGSGPLEAFLSLQNAASGPADLLRGSFQFDFGTSQDFGLFGFESFSGLAAGQGLSGLRIAFDPSRLGLGDFDDTVQLLAMGYNGSGYEGGFSPILLRVNGRVTSTPVPEPGTLLLMLVGLGGIAAVRVRRRTRY